MQFGGYGNNKNRALFHLLPQAAILNQMQNLKCYGYGLNLH